MNKIVFVMNKIVFAALLASCFVLQASAGEFLDSEQLIKISNLERGFKTAKEKADADAALQRIVNAVLRETPGEAIVDGPKYSRDIVNYIAPYMLFGESEGGYTVIYGIWHVKTDKHICEVQTYNRYYGKMRKAPNKHDFYSINGAYCKPAN